MKPTTRILPILLLVATLAHSQDEIRPATNEIKAAPEVLTTARIIGEIPDGSPPPPAPPKPEFHVATRDIISTATHEQGGRTITIREIKPIDLPPPPPPAKIAVGEVDTEFNQRLADYSEAHPKNEMLFLGATVFRFKDGPPRTLVRWWPQGKKEAITFWSSADFALIAGGIHSFADSSGDTHQILLGWDNVDLDHVAELHTRTDDAPDLPVFPENEASFQIAGDTKLTAEEQVVIQSLHDIYNSEEQRLRAAYEARERTRIEREAYLKNNPPQPKDITLNFWRTEKPATTGKGESK